MPEVTVGPDAHIFTYFALLNRFGYDLEGNPEMHPVRIAVREALNGLSLPDAEGFRAYYAGSQPFYPNVFLAEVYALHLDAPPSFDGPPVERLDSLYRSLERELPISIAPEHFRWIAQTPEALALFWSQADLEDLWRSYLPEHQKNGDGMAAAIRDLLLKAQAKLGITGWPFSRVSVIVNLLQSDWLADLLLVDDTLWVILGSSHPSFAASALHEALHLVIRPYLKRNPHWIGASLKAGLDIKGSMKEQGYWGTSDEHGWYRALQEEIVRALTIWVEEGPDGYNSCRGHANRGFKHVPAIWAALEDLEGQPLGEGLLERIISSFSQPD